MTLFGWFQVATTAGVAIHLALTPGAPTTIDVMSVVAKASSACMTALGHRPLPSRPSPFSAGC